MDENYGCQDLSIKITACLCRMVNFMLFGVFSFLHFLRGQNMLYWNFNFGIFLFFMIISDGLFNLLFCYCLRN